MLVLSSSAEAATRGRQPAPPQTPPTAGTAMTDEKRKEYKEIAELARRNGTLYFNFKDMDLVDFMWFMSEVLQENFIVPPNKKNQLWLYSIWSSKDKHSLF